MRLLSLVCLLIERSPELMGRPRLPCSVLLPHHNHRSQCACPAPYTPRQVLNLADNQLSGTLPPSFSSLTGLKVWGA